MKKKTQSRKVVSKMKTLPGQRRKTSLKLLLKQQQKQQKTVYLTMRKLRQEKYCCNQLTDWRQLPSKTTVWSGRWIMGL